MVNEKSLVDKPLTDAAKVAVNCTDAALVVVPLTAVNELMVVATVTVMFLVTVPLLAVPSPTKNDMVRVADDAALLEKVMDRRAVW